MEWFEHVSFCIRFWSDGMVSVFVMGKTELFCHSLLYTGTVAHIEKALAENFIHIFVNNSERLTEFLEHMIRVSYILSGHQCCVTVF